MSTEFDAHEDERAEAREIRQPWQRLDRAREEVSADDWHDRT